MIEQLKEQYKRFRRWQEQPFEYKLASPEVHHCNNCGMDFTGNYCPICSQRADLGRVSWRSVQQGFMDVWGLGTRSLLYSIWQILWRPGHVIAEYIDGKRQVSFPPVKMLFILAVLYSMLTYWFLPNVLHVDVLNTDVEKNAMKTMGDFYIWLKNYYSWSLLIMAVLAVFPTWFMFRYSPQHTLHSLPEGFFIQVFLAVIIIVFNLLGVFIGIFNPDAYSIFVLVLIGVYYIIAYKYLFGYGLWGTLWRCGFIYLGVLFFITGIVVLVFGIDTDAFKPAGRMGEGQVAMTQEAMIVSLIVYSAFFFVVGFIINLIATRKARRQIKEARLH